MMHFDFIKIHKACTVNVAFTFQVYLFICCFYLFANCLNRLFPKKNLIELNN